MKLTRYWAIVASVLVFGLILRTWLGFFVFPNQGFAWDLATFGSWIDTIQTHGFEAYDVDPGINYPPVFADVLALLVWLSDQFGIAAIDLIKWPSILADLATSAILAHAGRRWFSDKLGIFAASAFTLLPITWYDSAIWGQVDSLAVLPMLLATYFVIERKPEWSLVFFVVAVLTKPQGALVVLILLPVLIGQLINRELKWWRSLTAAAAALMAFMVIAVPWSLESYAPRSLAMIPVVGDLVGLAGQYLSTAGLFPVLTANAYNIWAAAGKIPMANQFQEGRVYWLPDSFEIFGIPAGIIGTALFLAVVVFVFWRLIGNHSARQVFTASSLLLVAFFALPTRVHERYLVQAFAFLVITWGATIWHRAAVVVLSIANTINLHAILAADLRVETIALQSESMAASQSLSVALQNLVSPHTGGSPEYYGLSWVRMPADWAREPWLVWAIIFVHTAALILLIWQFQLETRKAKYEIS